MNTPNGDFNSEAVRMLRLANADVRDGINNPSYGLEMLPALNTTIDRVVAMLSDPRAGRKGLRVGGLSAITIAANATTPVDGNVASVRWPKRGVVIGMRVGTTDGLDTSAASISMKVTMVDGETNLFTDGQTDAFMPFTSINTVASPWWPLWIPVDYQEIWNITPRNERTGASAQFSATPQIAFAYLSGGFYDDGANEAIERAQGQMRAARGLPGKRR
jgi:hypothetical protein